MLARPTDLSHLSAQQRPRQVLALCRVQRPGTKAAGLKAANLLRSISFFPGDTAASPAASEQEQEGPAVPTPKTLTCAQTAVDYEFGKAFSQQDADRYFGGMRGVYPYNLGYNSQHNTIAIPCFQM